MATLPATGLVDYKAEASSGEEGEDEYIVPQKRARVDRSGNGACFSLIMPTFI